MMNTSTERLHRPLWFSLLIITAIVLGMILVAQASSIWLTDAIWGVDIRDIQNITSNYETGAETIPHAWEAMMLIQAISAFCGFIVGGFLYLALIEKRNFDFISPHQHLAFPPVFWTILMVVIAMPITAYIAYWNTRLQLPGFLREMEAMMMEKEESAKKLTELLTNFQASGSFIIGLIVIAVIPAIGEELIFRGLIQNFIWRATKYKNEHLAVWVAAFIFSAIHFQFYGLIPRMLLGALFGYLYIWSRNIWYPIIAHFINNGVTLLGIYLYNQGKTEINLDNPDGIPIVGVLLSVLLVSGLIYQFRRHFLKETEKEPSKSLLQSEDIET